MRAMTGCMVKRETLEKIITLVLFRIYGKDKITRQRGMLKNIKAKMTHTKENHTTKANLTDS